jgi:hypothetical protein
MTTSKAIDLFTSAIEECITGWGVDTQQPAGFEKVSGRGECFLREVQMLDHIPESHEVKCTSVVLLPTWRVDEFRRKVELISVLGEQAVEGIGFDPFDDSTFSTKKRKKEAATSPNIQAASTGQSGKALE